MIEQKICVITGANSGIGKAAAVQINQAGYHVILACRNPSRGEAALEDIHAQTGSTAVELMIVDMSLQSSIKQFANTFQSKYKSLDVLIHNAGVFVTKKTYTIDNLETVFQTNYLASFILNYSV